MGRKVKSFLTHWLERTVDDIPVKSWCTSDPQNVQNAKCLLCPTDKMPFGRTFNCGEGFTAIEKHYKTKTHLEAVAAQLGREASGELNPRQLDIGKAIRNQEKITEKVNADKNQLLKSQILFTNLVHNHLLPSDFFTCFAKIAPKLFPDFNIAKL